VWGLEEPGAHDRLLVVSPHLDDAVISCGALMRAHPGAIVVTMFAASPALYSDPLNEHDTACGFEPGTDTMAVRRDEDVVALGRVGARPHWLSFCQNSHAERRDPVAVIPGAIDALVATIEQVAPSCVVAPLGLLHPDHMSCHATALAASERIATLPWLWYSDLPYVYVPGVLATRTRALHKAGYVAAPACPVVDADADAKWHAFEGYATQVAVMDGLWNLRERLRRAGEFYWELTKSTTSDGAVSLA
jgi:LmbE family N-acetylglucosaminyl deacetylase